MRAAIPAAGAPARPLIIIAGPTASGKSALALGLARRFGGTVINADAMQCYQELRIVTARPSLADEQAAPHRLYGVRAAADPANAAWWRQAALAAMQAAALPILCGGTGMYLRALLHGIADIPDAGAAARAAARALLAAIGPAALHSRLDAATAAKLHPADSQRIARAYEVLTGTGQGLAAWQARPATPLQGWAPQMILLDPPRAHLRGVIAARFTAMLAAGALAEVAALLAQNLPPALPLLRAHGVPELSAHLQGNATLEDAAAAAVLATYQYTKRQATWFRHQPLVQASAMQTIQSPTDDFTKLSERIYANVSNFMNNQG